MPYLPDVVNLCLYHMLHDGWVHSQGVAGDREGVGADWHHHSHTHTGLHLQPYLVTQIDSGNYTYNYDVSRAPPTPNFSTTTVKCERFEKRAHFAQFWMHIDFKAAYLRNTVCDLNETWVVYTLDVAVAMNQKWSHSVEPQWQYGAELLALSIVGQFLENGHATKA